MEVQRIVSKGNTRGFNDDEFCYGMYDDFHHYEYTLLNGEYHGAFYVYYRNGQILQKLNYVRGQKQGLQLTYNENGTLSLKYYCKDGMQHGDFYAYGHQGHLDSKDTYENGEEVGTTYGWRSNGSLAYKKIHTTENGHQIIHGTIYHANGAVKIKYEHNITKRTRVEEHWDEAGVPVPTPNQARA